MIFKNCRLVGALTDGIASEHGAVWIDEKGLIRKIYKSETEVEDTDGQKVFDCKGKTLLPGLFDIHTHVTGLVDVDYTKKTEMERQAQEYLKYGFTTIRDCGSMKRSVSELRDRIKNRKTVGPDILSCGKIVTPTETSEKDSLMPMYAEADGPYEMRKKARREIAEGADFIKTMASGSAFHRQGIPLQPIIMEDEIQELVKTAKMKGTYVAAHAHADAAIALCIKNGVRTIEHATYLGEESLDLLKNTKDCYLVPTLAAMYVSVSDPDGYWSRRLGEMLTACTKRIQRAYKEGLKLGFGTDSTVGMPQYEEGMEFRYRKELCHMDDLDILLQATKYSAEIVGLDNVSGEIKEGLQADFILVDGKPDQDISVMYHRPEHVWKKGVQIV